MLKQRLHFSGKEKKQTMDSLAIIQSQTIVETMIGFSKAKNLLNQRLHFPGTEKMETIDRFAIT